MLNRQGAKDAPVKHPERAPGFTGQAKEDANKESSLAGFTTKEKASPCSAPF